MAFYGPIVGVGGAIPFFSPSRFFIERAEAAASPPGSMRIPPAVLSPRARPLPLRCGTPLRVIYLECIRPQRSLLRIPPQVPFPGMHLRAFLLLRSGTRLRPVSLPVSGSRSQDLPPGQGFGVN